MNEKFSVYGRLVRDPEISHGAFRLWHALRDYADARGKCWPGQRRLQQDLHCSMSSVKKWILELIAGGYLAANVRGGARTTYLVLNGLAAGKNPITKQDAPAVSKTGNRSNTIEVKPRSKGDFTPNRSTEISWEKELERVTTEINKKFTGKLSEYDRESKSYNRLAELLNRQTELRTKLGVVA